ncbi:MAG TPA: DUF4388 domain-containing protein [Thermoanaerobaculia bacterium]|nr:DUF4388 domain-containing protein [Thermoanaerobaculia bacterium]
MSSSQPAFEYRASLEETALPEMLLTVDRFQVPGVIEAEREGVVKQVYIREGNVVHASSTDRDDSLGSYLQRTGKITAEQYSATLAERAAANTRHGELLIELDLISPAGIYEAIRKQIESIVWSLFYWQEGEVRFRIGTFQTPGGIRIQLPMRQVILQGIKRAPNAKALVARLGKKETVFEASFTTEDLIQAALDPDEYRLLGLIDGRRTLYQVCTEGPMSPAENAKLVYAFHVLRLVRCQEPAAATLAHSRPAAGETARPAVREPERKAIKIRFKTGSDRLTA